jgi:hypothetical protein
MLGFAAVAIASAGFVMGACGDASVTRWLAGEPLATQRVDEAADALEGTTMGRQLEQRVEEILAAYLPVASTLPRAEHVRGHLVPPNEIPQELIPPDGGFGGAPDILLRSGDDTEPPAVILGWGHMRHAVIVYANAPDRAPAGFFVRSVSPRTWVVANES